jgi:hypothetical protein
MSAQLEKSFLSRSQRPPQHDFDAGSYDDLSEASEEDAVLAFLREEKEAYANRDSDEENRISSEDRSVKSVSDQSESEVRANNFVRMFSKRTAFKKQIEPEEDEEKREEGSDSEYVVAQIRPIFPGSERSSHFSSHHFDDSYVERGLLDPDEDADNKNTESKADAEENKKEFWKSKYFIPACAFLLVVIIVIAVLAATTGSETKEPTMPPANLDLGNESVPPMPASPSPAPTFVINPSVWVQGEIFTFMLI